MCPHSTYFPSPRGCTTLALLHHALLTTHFYGLCVGAGTSAQAEAVGGEDCSDNGERQEVGGGIGPEQAVGAEFVWANIPLERKAQTGVAMRQLRAHARHMGAAYRGERERLLGDVPDVQESSVAGGRNFASTLASCTI
jgi:hypothetical protein